MKTTIDISDDLAVQAKQLAKSEGTTLRAIIEQGIRLKLEQSCQTRRYQLPNKSVKGQGLQAEFRDKTWEEIREAAYEYSVR
jgi:histidinol phosphatase-like PHP family hydrolase